MERQAFTVLPPLSPRLPPPPKTPASSRVAPRSVAHRDKNAFVILAEVGDHGPSGRSSPFRGRGFRAPSPQNSRIPVPSGKSAPSSPAKNKSSVTNGKSAPSTPSKKATTNGQASAKKRTESPSKVPVSKTNSPQVSPTKETQKKVAGKPPLAKNNATSRNSKAPQPAKRSEQSTRPTPTARTRLNNKPISTQNHRLTQNRTENKNRIAGNGTDISATSKRDNGNENNTSKGDNNIDEKKGNNTDSIALDNSGDKSAETAGDVKVINKEETKVHAEVEVKTDSSNGNNNNNISVVTSNPSSNPEEIHKISIEINSENGAKRDNINETVVVINEISGQNSKTKEESKGDTEKKNLKSQNIDENDNNDKKSKTEQVTVLTNDANIKSISKNGKLDIKDLHANNINSKEAVELSKMKETVVDIEDDMITAITDAITNIDENSIERIPDKDATLVEWTTKQPLELAKPQPDVIPTDPAVVSIEETTEETVQGPPEVEVEAGNHTVTFRSPEIHPVSPRGRKYGPALWDRFRERVFSCCRRDKNKNIKVKPAGKPNGNKKNDDKPSFFSRLCKWRRKDPPPPRLNDANKTEANNKNWNVLGKLNCCKKCKKKGGAINPEPPSRTTRGGGTKWWRKLFCLDRACCNKCKRKKPLAPAASIKKKEKPIAPPVAAGLPKLEPSLVEHTSVMKASIPVLPLCLAWFCLILNIFLPGTGTITSGFLCLCFGKPRFSVNDTALARLGAFCVDFIVGVSQIFTIIFCLVGWGWSIWWGVMMVRLSRKNRRIKLAEKAAGTQAPAVNQNHDLERGGQ